MNICAQTSGNFFFQPYINSAVLHMLALVSSALFWGIDINILLIFVSYL